MRLAPIALLLIAAQKTAPAAVEIPLTAETTVRFASADEGAEVLGKRDRFVRATSVFDRQVRLQTNTEATEADLTDNLRRQALEWHEEGVQRMTAVVKSLGERLKKLRAPLPKTVLLVLAASELESGYAHCRENAVVLPRHILRRSEAELERLLAHELFHIVSRHNLDLRRELYEIVGFTLCDEIALPPSLQKRKLTNPDAPVVDCYIELTDGGQTTIGAPVLYSSVSEYNPADPRKLMDYVTFRLLVLERKDGALTPALRQNGQAIVVDPREAPSFFEQIGKNTTYIIHPDEILADNFVHLVMGAADLATPRLVNEMAKLLGK